MSSSAPNHGPKLDVTVHRDLESLERLRADWDALLDAFPSATTFSTPEWLFSWWRSWSGSGQLCVLELRDPASRDLIALAPLARTIERSAGLQVRVIRFMGDGTGDSDHLDLPVRGGCEALASRTLLDWFQDSARDWDICRLNTMPSDSPLGNQLLSDLRACHWTSFTTTEPNAVIELPEGWESYLKSLSSKERGKIGLRTRRLEKHYKVRTYRCEAAGELDTALAVLFDLHGKHWRARGRPGSFESKARREFYRELGCRLLERRRLQFWLLDLDGKTVAAQFGFRHGVTVFSLQEGFDPDHTSDSPGYVLRSQALKQLISEGVRRYDFLGGTDESKLRWGAEVKSYLNLEFARLYTRGSAVLTLKYRGIDAKHWLRSRLPARAWRILKAVSGAKSKT